MNNIKLFFIGFKKGFKDFGHIITNIINSILLSIVYIIGVGLTSIFSKLFKKHFLGLKKRNTKTYWRDLNLKKKNIEKYYRQF